MTMSYGGSPRGGQPPTWPLSWGPASGGSLMPWEPPPGAGYWPPPPQTLDTTLADEFGTMDVANTVGTFSRRPADALGNAVDTVGISSRRVRSGMICIFSNYKLRIIFFQYHTSLVKYRFLRSYSDKSRIYVAFHEFYGHLTCLYLCLGDFGLTT
jgi:hypothetical protein